jgi:hypothetical protein
LTIGGRVLAGFCVLADGAAGEAAAHDELLVRARAEHLHGRTELFSPTDW